MVEFAEKCKEGSVSTDAKERIGAIVEFLRKSSHGDVVGWMGRRFGNFTSGVLRSSGELTDSLLSKGFGTTTMSRWRTRMRTVALSMM